MKTSFGIADDDLKYYKYLAERVSKPPQILYPFFFYDFSKPSFLTDYMVNHFLYGEEGINEFINTIKTDSDFFQEMLSYYFDKNFDISLLNDNNGLKLTHDILHLDLDERLIVPLLHLVTEFSNSIPLLLHSLLTVYCNVAELHKHEKEHINSLIHLFMKQQFLDQLNSMNGFYYDVNSSGATNNKFSISLLNFLLVFQKSTIKSGSNFIFGERCYEFYNISPYSVEPREICEILGNPVKSAILNLLLEKEFTATQLADKMYVSRQAINRHLLYLMDYNLVTISKTIGPEKYYIINRGVFKIAKSIVLQYMQHFITQEDKNKGDHDDGQKMENA